MKDISPITETIQTPRRNEMIDVTRRLEKLLLRHNVQEGIAVVYVPHTTAAVTINENADPDVRSDMLQKLQALAPQHESYYRHAEGNSDSHVKASLVGNSVTVIVHQGRFLLGRWQGIYFCEFDGPRTREMILKLIRTGD